MEQPNKALRELILFARAHNSYIDIGLDCNGKFWICIHDAYIRDGIALTDVDARGDTAEQAANNYLFNVRFKELIFHPWNEQARKTVYVV